MRFLRALRKVRHRPRDFLVALLILGILGPLLIGGSAAAAFYLLPLPAVVPDPTAGSQAQTSRVFAPDGTLIATFHSEHNRELIPLNQMPLHLQYAALAAEDARFFEHSGLDLKAVARAAWADIRARSTVQGGSTITQQYVKNVYIEAPKRTIFRKVREALLASVVERTFTKQKILTDYLNTVYLGKGAYGVQAAAKTYFKKPASELSLSESALLAGIIPAPVRFSPYENPSGAEQKRQFVLNRMVKLGFVDQPAAAAAIAAKPVLAPLKQQVFKYPWFVDALYRSLKNNPKYGEARIFSGGLQIFATVDPRMQEAAEKVLEQTLDNPKDPAAALASIEPLTGYVRAVAGSRPFSEENKFNLAVQARRQPGSSFKPFVLVAALEKGIKPSSTYSAPSQLCPKGWPKDGCPVNNYGNSGYGRVTVEKATINSINTAYAQMIVSVTPKKIVEVGHRMGIKTDVKPFHAVGLGSGNVTPFEMASAYATLAANGVYHEPRFYSEIRDGAGNVIEKGAADPVQAIDSNIAAKVNEILQKAVLQGTGKRAKIGRPQAGKTGTATEFRNAWFCGYTPDLSTAVWMGYKENERQSMRSVHGVRNVAGGTIPAEMWADYMKVALDGIPPTEFLKGGEIRISRDGDNELRLPPYSGPRPTPSPSIIEEVSPSPEPTASPIPSNQPSPLPTGLPGPSP